MMKLQLKMPVWIILAAALGVGTTAATAQAQGVGETRSPAGTVITQCGKVVFEALSPAEKVAYVSCVQREVAAAFRSTLPHRLDPVTVITDITADGVLLTYHYKAEIPRAQFPPNAIEALMDRSRKFPCESEIMSGTIGAGGQYRFVWSDLNGDILGEVTIDHC